MWLYCVIFVYMQVRTELKVIFFHIGNQITLFRNIVRFADVHITKTCLYNVDLLKPHFYIVKLGFTGVYIIFLISAQKHRLWVPVRTASPRRF